MNIYVWNNEWLPGENTVAYYPLTSTTTVNDMSGNNRNLTNSGVTFGTYAGVDCANFDNYGDKLYNSSASWLPSGKVALTISVWAYYSNLTSSNWSSLFSMGDTNHHAFSNIIENNSLALTDYGNAVYSDFMPTTGQWYNLVFTAEANSNTWKIYVNGTARTTSGAVSSYAGLSGTNFRINGFFWDNSGWGIIGSMSEFIFENKTRTDEQVALYYNQTKSNYGL